MQMIAAGTLTLRWRTCPAVLSGPLFARMGQAPATSMSMSRPLRPPIVIANADLARPNTVVTRPVVETAIAISRLRRLLDAGRRVISRLHRLDAGRPAISHVHHLDAEKPATAVPPSQAA